jgi:autotransporter-associated beta strand protein
MTFLSWLNWLRSFRRRRVKTARKPRRMLNLEHLETRLAPATHIWTGAAGDGSWKNAANWTGGAVTGLRDSDGFFADLVFSSATAPRITTNDLTVANPTFDSITISASGYSLLGTAGRPIVLGDPTVSGSGFVLDNAGPGSTATIGLDMQLGGLAGTNQFIDVQSGATLTISGQLSSPAGGGAQLTKKDTGTLVLTHDNTPLTAPVSLQTSGGILQIQNPNALGSSTTPVTVGTNAQLQVDNPTPGSPFVVTQNLVLNGPGITNDGALLLAKGSGSVTWAGNIELDSNSVIGSNVPLSVTAGVNSASSLTITGQISDNGAGHDLTKEGVGQVVFDPNYVDPLNPTGPMRHDNTYRGRTIVNNGLLTIRSPGSLGDALTSGVEDPTKGTIVNSSVAETGTLQLQFDPNELAANDPNGILLNSALPFDPITNPYIGFTVLDEQLTLNGPGANGVSSTQYLVGTNLGALAGGQGSNQWAGNVVLGSPTPNGSNVSIGVSAGNTLTVSGVISDVAAPSGPFNLTKVDAGRLIFNNQNTYKGTTDVEMGALNIRDSQGLGKNGGGGTTVDVGATLELQVDTGLDPHGRALATDSVTGLSGNGPQLGMTIAANLTLNGNGLATAGALHSISGINVWTGNITLGGQAPDTAIGVDADPNASNNNNYFTHDYSLTVTGVIGDNGASPPTSLEKNGAGQLILNPASPTGNTYTGLTFINQGWVTAEQDHALGAGIPGLAPTIQPAVLVSNGAALHLKTAPGIAIATGATGATESGSVVTIKTTAAHNFALGQKVTIAGVGAGYDGTFTIASIVSPTSFTYINTVTGLAGAGGGTATLAGINLDKNLILTGVGVAHPFSLISQKGALMSLGGNNVISGAIQLEQNVGIGVENPDPNIPFSELTVTGAISDFSSYVVPMRTQIISGRKLENPYVLPTMFGTGNITVSYDMGPLGPPPTVNDLRVYYGPRGTTGSTKLADTGLISGTGTLSVSFPALSTSTSNQLELVFDEGSNLGFGNWSYTATITANNPGGGGITKFGSRRLNLQGEGTYSNANEVQNGVLRVQNDTALGRSTTGTAASGTDSFSTTTTAVDPGATLELTNTIASLNGGISAGVQVLNEHLVLDSAGDHAFAQTLTIPTGTGNFTLSFNGSGPSALINPSSLTLAEDIQKALDNLSTIGGLAPVAGSVSVTQSASNPLTFTIVFGGGLAGATNLPLITATSTATVSQVVLQGLENLSQDNMWRGPATLGGNSTIDVAPNSRLSLFGSIDDRVQTVTLPTLTGSGQFTLKFMGATTAPLNVNDPDLALSIRNALNSLATIGGLPSPGFVNVAQETATNPSAFTISFDGSLYGTAQPLLVAGGVGIANPVVAAGTGAGFTKLGAGELVLAGASSYHGVTHIGTSPTFGDAGPVTAGGLVTIENGLAFGTSASVNVANGSTLQLQGNVTVPGVPLNIEGTGLGVAPQNVPLRWQQVGADPINNGQTGGNQAVSGRVTGIATDPTDPNTIYISTAGGGAWKTTNGGLTWQPMFDSVSNEQLLSFSGLKPSSATQTAFTLTFNGQTTPTITLTGGLGNAADVATIQNALNSLSTIGGVGGSVNVIQTGTGLYSIIFGGSLAATANTTPITVTVTASTATANVVKVLPAASTPQVAMFTGAITIDPNDSNVLYLGTGEANNSTDSYYGTGVYVSGDRGQTWAPLVNADGSNPLNGLAVSKIVVDPGTTQSQTLTIPSFVVSPTAQAITLSFFGATTPQIALNSPTLRLDIQNALNTLIQTTLGDVVGSVNVSGPGGPGFFIPPVLPATQTIGPLVYTITFTGNLAGTNPPLMTATGFGLNSNPLVTPSSTGSGASRRIYVATSDLATNNPTTSVPGVYRFDGTDVLAADGTYLTPAWYDLTGTATQTRLTQIGKAGTTPGTAGPDDDFRVSFPQSKATWSDLSLIYADPGVGTPVPVLYAALGTAAGDTNSAVFRTIDPELATIATTKAPTIAAVPSSWHIGDPAAPSELQSLTIVAATTNYTLTFGGSTTVTISAGLAPNAEAQAIQNALNATTMSSIYGVGGHVNVVFDAAASFGGTSSIFKITFGGALANQLEPLLVATATTAPAIAQVTAGSGFDDESAGEFPTGSFPPVFPPVPRDGTIKITVVGSGGSLSTVTLYAAITVPNSNLANAQGQLLEVLASSDGGQSWAPTTTPSPYLGLNTGVTAAQGNISTSILAMSASTVFVGGEESNAATHTGQILETTDGGMSWTDISIGADGNGPHSGQHTMTLDTLGRLLVGTDGGIWRLDNPTPGAIHWTDLNGDLAITQFNGVSGSPSDPNVALGGSQGNGVELFNGSTAWTETDTGDSGQVHFDPQTPSIAYAVHITSRNGIFGLVLAHLDKSTDGGNTWTPTNLQTSLGGLFPFLVDSNNPSRLLAGGFSINGTNPLWESLDGGTTWTDLSPNLPLTKVTALAAASFQGTFQADTGFTLVTDKGANTPDADTIYVTNGTKIAVTKNHGQSWKVRTPVLPAGAVIQDLAVDAGNRDTAYAVVSSFSGGGSHVFETTNAGQTWTDISGSLPDMPVYKIVVDPRHNLGVRGTLYIGTDDGVWTLPSGNSTWAQFGVGMPRVQVHDLELNQTLNMLTAGTYGRSMYQLFLSDVPPGSPPVYGVLRATSGTSIWTGPVHIAGDSTNTVVVAAAGTQAVQNGIATAQLDIVGTISDLTPGSNPSLQKFGQGDVVLSGANTYGGVTEVKQGVLVVDNPSALGAAGPTADTIVDAGTALELQSDLALETVHLNGDGILFNGHNTGALRNSSNNNTFTGTIVLDTNSTIGVDSGSTLTIGTKTGLLGTGTIADNSASRNLTKELTGTLILASANTYGGKTEVNQGVLLVQNAQALGSTANGTDVFDGAQLQLQTPTTGPLAGQPVVVSGESLTLSGSGINGTGALLNVGGNNTWNGPISLDSNPVLLLPNLTPATTPSQTIAIGVTNASDTLTVGTVGQLGGNFGLNKVGAGRLTLTTADSYNGLTTVTAGALRIQNNGALGTMTNGTVVQSGAALELDGDPTNVGNSITVSGEDLTLSGTGIGGTGALLNVSGNNTWQTSAFTGNVILVPTNVALSQINTAIGVNAGQQLTISGTVKDPTPVSVPAASLTKVGAGTLVFPSANTYSGKTFVNAGVLNIRNAGALGAGAPEKQTLTVIAASGTFQLTFNGSTSPTLLNVNSPTLRADIAAALNALPTIANVGGSVTVTQGAAPATNVFTVTFGGSLASTNVPQITATGSTGVTVIVNTVNDGPEGTVVNSGATLQVQSGITVSTEALTLNGSGFNNAGALENVSGTNTWANPVTLGSNASIGVDAPTDSLIVNQPIGDNGLNFGVTKVGAGTLDYAGNTSNTYIGLTQVNQGTLLLDKSGGAAALNGNLTIGDSLPGAAAAKWNFSNEMPATATVTVNSDGTLNLNDQTQTIAALNVTDGTVTTGAGTHGAQNGLLTVSSLSMTGGAVTLGTAGSQLVLNGGVTASSDAATGTATIAGAGSLVLGGNNDTFTVNHGTNAVDLAVNAPITSTAAGGITKGGNGLMAISNANPGYLGNTTINAGNVQVDGTIGNVVLGGGIVSGDGTIGTITGPGAVAGTVSPGDSAAPSTIGTLTSNAITWGSGTNFAVDLAHTSVGAPVPGVDNDVLSVNGNVSLGGATLTGTVGAGIAIGDHFTILHYGSATLTGKFAEPFASNTVFIGGVKFAIDYGNLPTSFSPGNIVLTRVANSATTVITSSANPSIYGQDVTFTATVTPETGAAALPAGGQVTFVLDATSASPITQTVTLNASNQATFDPQALAPAFTWSTGPHTIDATYHDPSGLFSNSVAPTLTQTVNVSPTSTSVTANTAPVFGQPLVVTATVTVNTPPATANPANPASTVTFFVDGTALSSGPVTVDSTGHAQVTLTNLGLNNHHISATYSGDNNYAASSTPSNLSVTVVPDNANVIVTANPAGITLGQTASFTVTVSAAAPGTGTPTGTVQFFDGLAIPVNSLGTVTLVGGTASVSTSALRVGASHTIVAVYSGDADFNGGNGMLTPFTVGKANSTVTVTPASTTAAFGQSLTFTATVAPVAPATVAPTGTVTIVVDGVAQSTATALSGGVATLTLSNLAAGSHTINVNYNGDGNYNTSSTTSSASVTVSTANSATALALAPSSSVFGQSVTFTATVTAVSPGVGTPTGTVNFVEGTTTIGSGTLNGSGVATFSTTTLALGGHSIQAQYVGDGNFIGSNSSVQTVTVNQAGTSTTLTPAPNPSVFGQSVTFTATVTAASPSTATPTGTVNFVEGTTTLGSGTLSGGVATFSTSTLPVGSHNIVAQYVGDGNFASSNSATATQQVNKAGSSTVLVTDGTPSAFASSVTFTATVTAFGAGKGTPSGTVTFNDGTTTLGTGTLNGLGVATFSTSTLAIGSHSITAVYNGDGNFNGGTSNTVAQSVNAPATATALTSSANPGGNGQPITFTATITATGGGTPTGTVSFVVDGGAPTAVVLNSSGVATFITAFASNGPHTVEADYLGNTNFLASSNTLTENVLPATTTSLTANPTSSTFGQNVTFTATVAGSGATGTVTFFDGAAIPANQIGGPVTIVGGMATFSTSTLTGGTHTINAVYSGDANFAGSTGTLSFTVAQAATSTALTANPTSTTFGQSVTFTATVNSAAGTPTGSVTFMDGTNTLGTVGLSGGVATFSTSALTGGSHTITASYSGDTNFAVSPISSVTYSVILASSSTALTAPTTSVFGQPVTLTATVSSAFGVPTGTVTFKDGTTTLGTGTLNGSGIATFTTSTLSVSTHSLSAVYNSDGNFLTSTGTDPSLVVTAAATKTTVTDAPATTSANGQTVTLTAHVATNSPSTATVNAGSVTFKDGATTLGTVAVNAAGNASLNTATLAVGGHSITAVYGVTTDFGGSTSTAIAHTVSSLKFSTTAVTESATTSVFGQGVTFTATVTGTGGTPTGSVTFFSLDGSLTPTTVTLTAGKANFVISGFGVGAHTVSAKYNGDTVFAANTGASPTATLTVNKANTTVTVTSSAATTTVSTAVTFTASVATVAPGAGVPTGQVQFKIDNVVQPTLVNIVAGKASLTVSNLAVGTHTITATYITGDSLHNASPQSAALVETIQSPATKLVTQLSTTAVSPNVAFNLAVYAENGQSSVVSNFNGPVTLTVVSTPTGGALTNSSGVKAPLSVTFVNGIAVFTGLKVTLAGSYVVKLTTPSGLNLTITITTLGRQV